MRKLSVFAAVFGLGLVISNAASADLLEGLVAWWPLDGDALDASGNGNDGVVLGPLPCEDRFDMPNGAMCFDGDPGDLIDIGNGVKPPFPLTVTAWVNPTVLTRMQVFRNDRVDDGGYRYGVDMLIQYDGELGFVYYEGFSAPWNRVNGMTEYPVIIPMEWQHIAVVFNGHLDVQLYWNCTEMPVVYAEDAGGSGMTYSSANGAIGHRNSVLIPFQGGIDDVRVYERSLSGEEIAAFCGGADLIAAIDDDPDPVTLRSTLTYDVTVTNNGPDPAEDVTLGTVLSRGVRVLQPPQVSQGGCELIKRSNTIACELGYLDAGELASITIRTRANRPGTACVTAVVEAVEAEDPNLENNTTTECTSVTRN